MPYEHSEHRHRFAVWAAARAAQRGFTTVEHLRDALEATPIRAFVENSQNHAIEAADFDKNHRTWCWGVINYLKNVRVDNATYGRAAKLVAIYLKTVVVIGSGYQTRLAHVAHPPIDRVLLQNLAKEQSFPEAHRALWRSTSWTRLNEDEYFALLETLRTVVPCTTEWWRLEEHWTVTNE